MPRNAEVCVFGFYQVLYVLKAMCGCIIDYSNADSVTSSGSFDLSPLSDSSATKQLVEHSPLHLARRVLCN